jgi:ubiquinone/menaquinone biosynthesis C-methylase UbiE
VAGVIYQEPLAYLLGLEGLALLRAFHGEYDRDFVAARIAEVRQLLDSAPLREGVDVARVSTVEGYRAWSATYDDPGNGLFDLDQPIVADILGGLPPGTALDAACGTGRFAEYLAGHGHRVIGVDSSPDMLARARTRVPTADFRLGDLRRLPLADAEVDVVVCALALTHVPELAPVFAQFARVLRPGGHLVVADVHHALVAMGSQPRVGRADGGPALQPAYQHLASDYLSAALPLGLQLRRCAEPRQAASDRPLPEPTPPEDPGPWEDWPWSLLTITPAATRAAWRDLPILVIWHFQREAADQDG